MKKLTLFLVAMLFSALSFAALNPFAYGLSSTLSPDQKTLTVNYSLNAPATSVVWKLMDGDKVILTQDFTSKGLTAGGYTATVNLDLPDIPVGKPLKWKIEVKGAAHNTTNNHGGYRFFHPSGVDVDNNPESPHFGRIICNEAMNTVKSKTDTYLSAKFGAGIFEFTPAFEPKPNGSKPGYNGGNTFVNTHSLYTTTNSNGQKVYNQTAYVTRRVRISNDGRIFVTSLNPTQDAYLWEINPDNLDDWNPIFQYAKKDTKYDMVDASGNFIAGPNVGFDVRGEGENLKLLMLSANINGMQFNQNEFKCHEYDLGSNKKWSTSPSREKTFNKKYAISFTGCQVQYDNEGGVWMIQYRTSSTESQPALVHINANGEQDYLEVISNFRNAGFRFNHDFTKVITADGRTKAGTYTAGYARIYNVSKDAGGKPVLEYWKVIDMSAVGKDLNDFAWDIADNVYVVGHNSEWIRAYALARTADDIATTPCASKYEFTINSAAQMSKASELNPYAYDLSSTFNSTTKELTVNYTLNANAIGVDIVILDGKMEMKRITCSGKTRGSHSETISVEGFPMNRQFTWNVEVKGNSKSVPTQVSTYYSLYCSHGLAIDKNPESEYFGRILAVEGMQAVPATGYLSSGKGAGIYVFTPEFATDGLVHNGGKDFTRQWASYGYQPWRVKISEDGRIFVSSCDLNGKFVWELSKDLKTWTEVLARGQEKNSTTMKGNAFTSDEGQFLAGMNLSMDVIGSGKDLKLLLYSASGTGITGQTQSLFRLDEYALGEATTWDNSKEPTQITCFSGKYGFMYSNVNIIYDGEGGYWFGASRAGNANQPNLVHFDKNGRRDYYSESAEYYGGDGILLHNGMLIKGKARTDANTGNFGVYTMSKDASGNLVLTEKWSVRANHIGRNLNEFAIDYGENLYVVGNSGEKIIAFAMPYSGIISTPAKAEYAFSIYPGYVPEKKEALNPFAYGLSSELINGGMDLKVNYSLNSQANSAKVVIMQGNTEVKTVDCTNLTKGSYSMVIPTEELPTGVDLTWKMVVNGTSVTKVEEHKTNYSLFHPSSVDIDNNPENVTFGLIITNEALHEVKSKTSGYLSANYGAGIFAFNAGFDYLGKYNGGNDFMTHRPGMTAANANRAYAPRRVRISDDGRIFVTSLNTNGDVLWEVNPENMDEWTPIFHGTQDATNDLVNGSTFVAGPNAGFDVRGSGDNLQLLMLSANTTTYGFGQRGFRISEYNLGTKTTWSSAPSKAFPHENLHTGQCYFISATGSQVQYDKDGGVWYIQNRGESTETVPGLVYFDKNGTEKCKLLYDAIENSGFRFNHDFTKVAIADNKFVNIYSVEKDANGVPVLKQEIGFSLATVGRNANDFAWDYANNFYAVGHTSEKIVAYRLPYSGEVTTPAASRYTFRVEYEVIVDENADNTTNLAQFENKEVTAKVVRSFTNGNYMTLTLPFDMTPAQISQAFGAGNATIYTFAYTQKDSEGTLELHFNTTNTIQAGYPYILKLKNAIDGFTVDGVTINTTLTENAQGTITMQPVLDAGGTLNGATQYWLASDNYLYNAQTYNTPILGLRAIFDIPAGSRVRARAVFNSNEATDVINLTPDQTNSPTVKKVLHKGKIIIIRGEEKYTIQGQRME